MARRKRVVVLPSWYPTRREPSTGIFIQDQVQCLASHFDVTVLTPRPFRWKQVLGLAPHIEEASDGAARLWRLRKAPGKPWRKWLPWHNPRTDFRDLCRRYLAAVAGAFPQYIEQYGRPDLLHAHVVLPAGWAAWKLGRHYGIPVVLTEHSGPFSMHLQSEPQRKIVRDVLRGVDLVLAVSPALAGSMAEVCPRANIHVLGNVVRTNYFIPQKSLALRNRFRFYLLARLAEEKGVQHFLDAGAKLLKSGVKQWDALIGGDGPYRPALEKLCRRLGLQKHCHFLGWQDRSQIWQHMQCCDMFVLPSLLETFGVVLGEAMACGKPVLATRCGGAEYVVTPETGLLVPPGDAKALAAAMADVLAGRHSFRPQTIRNSVVERFGEEAFVDNLSHIYDSILFRKPVEIQAA